MLCFVSWSGGASFFWRVGWTTVRGAEVGVVRELFQPVTPPWNILLNVCADTVAIDGKTTSVSSNDERVFNRRMSQKKFVLPVLALARGAAWERLMARTFLFAKRTVLFVSVLMPNRILRVNSTFNGGVSMAGVVF